MSGLTNVLVRIPPLSSAGSGPRAWIRILQTLILPVFLLLPVILPADAPDVMHPFEIVILNSYHPGYQWSDAEVTGVIETIQRHLPTAHVYLEYLDTKKVPFTEENRKYFDQTADQLRTKYRQAPINLLVAVDNDALVFLNRYGPDIWKDLPVVFCGVEHFQAGLIDRLPRATGVIQNLDFVGTVRVATRLFPHLKRFWVLHERSETGWGMRHALELLPGEIRDQFAWEFPEPTSFHRLLEESELLGSDTGILFLVLSRDLAGQVGEPAAFLARLGEKSPAPVFVLTEDRLGPGVVGGCLLSGRLQGNAAGELAVKMLLDGAGALPPIQHEASCSIMLYYPEIHRLGVSPFQIPETATILNRPPTFSESYPMFLPITVPVTVGLSAFILILLFNIRKRRFVEAELRASEEKYRQLFSSMTEGVALCEFILEQEVAVDYRLLEANPACLSLFGLKREVLGRTAREIWSGKEIPFLAFFETMRKKGRELTGEASYGAGRRTFLGNAFPLGALRFGTVFEDISDRKKAERTLSETLNTLNAVISASPSPIVTFDRECRVSLWNRAAERIFGWIATEVMGRPLPFIGDEKRAEFLEQVGKALKTTPPTFDFEVSQQDGSRQEFLVSVGELRDSQGVSIGTLGIFLEMTETRKTEGERKRLVEQLQQVQKLEALGRLAGGIAHDFNNQLTTIIGNSEMLKDEVGGNAEAGSLVQEILDAGKRSGALTEQLLTFSRRQMVAPQVIDSNRVIRGLQQTLGRLLGEQIRLRFEEMASDCFIRVESGLFEQALMNMAINSRDAMEKGGLLEFRTSHLILRQPMKSYTRDIPPGEYVVIEVADTGHGMDTQVMENLFDPFFTTKPIGKGTGLGLAMVYGFVSQHRGFIHVESQQGQGTRFFLYFPAEKRPDETPPAALAARTTDSARSVILLVEDEESVRTMMQRILKASGYDVLSAACGADALEAFAKSVKPVDLVLTDVVMPGMSGQELARKLLVMRPDLKVIFSSGYGDQVLESDSFSPDSVRVIGKPFPTDQLLNLIRAFLDKSAT